jgi:hypothetical protein
MDALAALLLREYCSQHQIMHAQQQILQAHQKMQVDWEETAPKSSLTGASRLAEGVQDSGELDLGGKPQVGTVQCDKALPHMDGADVTCLHAERMQLDWEVEAPKSSSTWPLAITLMVSSSNWSFPRDEDSSGALVSEIVGRLRRIACLPSEVLEDNECSLDKAAFVDWEPLHLKASERAEATSMPSGDSGGASSGPSPAADATKDYKKEMKDYVKDFKDRFGSFEDAASGEKMNTEETSIYVQASLSELGKDLPEFRTEAHVLNADDAPHDADRMRQLIEQRETSRRNGAEGEEERRLFLRRLGYDVSKGADASSQAEKTDMKVIESAGMLLHRLLKGHFMCLIGPPASGKTVTMLQVACAAVDAMQRRVDRGLLQDTLLPRIPIFMRAVELSTRMKQAAKQPETLESLVKIYVREEYPNAKHPRIADMLIYFLELRRVLILIDGLDEAADTRHVIEKMIDHTAGANDMCLMISMRDYAFETSRMQARFGGFQTLGAFEAFTILPLDEQRRGLFIDSDEEWVANDTESDSDMEMQDSPDPNAIPSVHEQHFLLDKEISIDDLAKYLFEELPPAFKERCKQDILFQLKCMISKYKSIYENKKWYSVGINVIEKEMPEMIAGGVTQNGKTMIKALGIWVAWRLGAGNSKVQKIATVVLSTTLNGTSSLYRKLDNSLSLFPSNCRPRIVYAGSAPITNLEHKENMLRCILDGGCIVANDTGACIHKVKFVIREARGHESLVEGCRPQVQIFMDEADAFYRNADHPIKFELSVKDLFQCVKPILRMSVSVSLIMCRTFWYCSCFYVHSLSTEECYS